MYGRLPDGKDLEKRADSYEHLRAWAELERRRSRYMMTSAIATSLSAAMASVAAIVAAILGEVEARDVASAKEAAAVQFDLDEIQRNRIMVQELA